MADGVSCYVAICRGIQPMIPFAKSVWVVLCSVFLSDVLCARSRMRCVSLGFLQLRPDSRCQSLPLPLFPAASCSRVPLDRISP